MKTKWILVLVSIFWMNIIHAQISDLTTLATGDLETFTALWSSNGKIYGYLLVYDQGNTSNQEKKFEYIVLDKNLNEVMSNHVDGSIFIDRYTGYINSKDELILYPILIANAESQYSKFSVPKSWKIDLKTNTATEWFGWCYEEKKIDQCAFSETIKEMKKTEKKEKKKNGFVYESNVYRGKYDGFLVLEYDDYEKYLKNYTLSKFDENKNEIWKYTIEDEATKKLNYQVNIFAIDSSHIFALKMILKKSEIDKCYLMVLDMKNGQLVKEQLLDQQTSESLITMLHLQSDGQYSTVDSYKSFDDKIILTGKIIRMVSYEYQTRGYFRCIIDKSSLDVTFDHLFFDTDFVKFIPEINEKGGLKKGYSMGIRDVFFLSDGSIIYIFEKYKFGSTFNTAVRKNDDLIFVITDQNFEIKAVEIIDKEKSKNGTSNYLFGQYLNNDKDFAFFFQDYKSIEEDGDKNWVLFINSWINGKLNKEQLPIRSDKNIIYPYIAKEGYILLREYNEKAKYNQIRLEKLNF